MEGSKKGEAVFDSMNLNPQLFLNETLNTVEDIVGEAFDFYTLEASNLLKIDGRADNNRSRELAKGIDRVRGMIQSVLEDRLRMWEAYCLRYTFAVPEDFVLPESVSDAQNIQPLPNDQDLDAELDSLRRKLHLERNRSVELNSELQALERRSVSNELSARLVNEVSKLYDESSVNDMSKEMTKVASELRAAINRLKTRRTNAAERATGERLKNNGIDFSATALGGKIEELDKFLAELRKM
ncbi:hypothetical protein Bca52824_046945 [Brassica carinata]|uniref:Protein MIS12 homolog n=1 Tax=Brassica carinata TaxID=52824 RepID=A0A8X7URP6_BRACI|nr:hypothetical protein Bca52824_046945 [Brassica carinata]